MTITLKDGSTTEDPRLDRLVQFDERSRQYPIRALLDTTKSLRSYTWRCNAWLDQGREGACVGFAYTHDAAARPAEVPGTTDALARDFYHQIQHVDPWNGCYLGHDGARYDGTSVLSGAQVMQKLGFFKEYRWAFGIDDVLMTLAYRGPVILGINWYNGMYAPNAEGYITPTGQIMGGHAILARGYSHKYERVLLKNSWGRDWGRDGDCYISVEDLSRLLQEDGEACVPSSRKTVPVPTTV